MTLIAKFNEKIDLDHDLNLDTIKMISSKKEFNIGKNKKKLRNKNEKMKMVN